MIAAWRGQDAEASELSSHRGAMSYPRGVGAGVSVAYYSLAVLCNGLGRYKAAFEAAVASDLTELCTSKRAALRIASGWGWGISIPRKTRFHGRPLRRCQRSPQTACHNVARRGTVGDYG